MFEAVLKEAGVLKKIIDALKDLVNEVNIQITPSGMSLQAMDSSHVALVVLTLDASGFESYRSDHCFTIGVSMSNFSKVMRLADPSEIVTL